jgi:hypothetical protein
MSAGPALHSGVGPGGGRLGCANIVTGCGACVPWLVVPKKEPRRAVRGESGARFGSSVAPWLKRNGAGGGALGADEAVPLDARGEAVVPVGLWSGVTDK